VKLSRSFYRRPTLEVAADLLGKVLVHRHRGVVTSGVIVEVEAYIGESDPACHAAVGRTERNSPLYGPPGRAYVYLNYGIHHCLNAIAGPPGTAGCVLIRALEPLDGRALMARRRGPLEGIDLMRRRRARGRKGRRPRGSSRMSSHELCRGPGNLTRAMGITLQENWLDFMGDRLFIEDRQIVAPNVVWDRRIGISVGTELPWRAYLEAHPAVSQLRSKA